MDLTEDQLKLVEEFAGYFLTIAEIAIILSIDIEIFKKQVKKVNSAAYLAYERGKLTSKIEIQKSIVKMARLGSPQAQKDVDSLISNQLRHER